MAEDIEYMKRAIELARRGEGLVSPNPMVGAVLVLDGEIVGEGHHRYDRLRHAESYAIEMAGERARGATLYCSLEPCCHYGRTPPCTDGVIEAGIARAVIAMSDPDPRVNGRGIEQLSSAGIVVEVGLCENEARQLNETYLKFVTTETPFVHGVIQSGLQIKWRPSAQFLDQAGKYDALMLGEDFEINHLIVEKLLINERHRPLVLIGPSSSLAEFELFNKTSGTETGLILIEFPSMSGADRESGGAIDSPPDNNFSKLLSQLGRMKVSSMLVLPRLQQLEAQNLIANSDRLTLLSAQPQATDSNDEELARSLTGATLNQIIRVSAGQIVELTGYIPH